MDFRTTKDSITISKEAVQRSGGVVVLPLKEYQNLQERAVPTYQLFGKKAEELDKLVEEGLRDYEAGNVIEASSLREALKKYAKADKNS